MPPRRTEGSASPWPFPATPSTATESNAAISQSDLDAITENASTNLDLSTTVLSFGLEQDAAWADAFLAKEDSQAPTVSEISFLERQLSWINPSGNAPGPGPAPDNIIEPGDHVYKLAAGDADASAKFGTSVAIDQGTVIVGSPVASRARSISFCLRSMGSRFP